MILKTIIFSFIIITLCLIGLGIGLILTGKSKLRKGCGIKPKGKCNKGKCEVCDPKKRKKEL